MTREEAIARIKNHKIAHKMNEPRAIYISEALDMAIEALEQEPCEDAISRQAVLDFYDGLIGECQVSLSTKGKVHFSCGKSYFDWYVKQLPSMAIPSADKWIPVSERLPDDGTYLVTVERIDGEPSIDMKSFAKDLNKVNEFDFPKHKCGWYDYDSEYGYWEEIEVIAWMHLPKPYEPQESEEV